MLPPGAGWGLPWSFPPSCNTLADFGGYAGNDELRSSPSEPKDVTCERSLDKLARGVGATQRESGLDLERFPAAGCSCEAQGARVERLHRDVAWTVDAEAMADAVENAVASGEAPTIGAEGKTTLRVRLQPRAVHGGRCCSGMEGHTTTTTTTTGGGMRSPTKRAPPSEADGSASKGRGDGDVGHGRGALIAVPEECRPPPYVLLRVSIHENDARSVLGREASGTCRFVSPAWRR